MECKFVWQTFIRVVDIETRQVFTVNILGDFAFGVCAVNIKIRQ